VICAGTSERLLPIIEIMSEHGRTETIAREQVGPATVATYEFKLPG
jgi:hypothetical protein